MGTFSLSFWMGMSSLSFWASFHLYLILLFTGVNTQRSVPDPPSDSIDLELNDCLQEGSCGIFPVCSYSFHYECDQDDAGEDDATDENAKKSDDPNDPCSRNYRRYRGGDDETDSDDDYEGDYDRKIQGNIVLLKNGMGTSSEYKWEIIGQEGKLYKDYEDDDDSALREYELPKKSSAYVDTTVHYRHRIRLYNSKQVVDTITSSDIECTIHEACQYFPKICQSSFTFSMADSTTELGRRCKEYARACRYFVYEPDLVRDRASSSFSHPSSSSSSSKYRFPSRTGTDATQAPNGDGGDGISGSGSNNERDQGTIKAATLALSASIGKMKAESNQCVTDCLWNYYPSKYLPEDKKTLKDNIDTIWLLRRTLLGLSLKLDECSDVEFVDDKLNLFRTNEDDPGDYGFVERESNQTHKKDVTLIVILVVVLIVLLVGIVIYWYNQYGKGRFSGMGGGGGGKPPPTSRPGRGGTIYDSDIASV